MRRLSHLFFTLFCILFLFTENIYAENPAELARQIQNSSNNARYEDAKALAESYIDKRPHSAYGYNAKAEALRNLNRLDEAIEWYVKALGYSHNREIQYGNIANTYRRMNRLDDAILYYNKSIEENKAIFADRMLGIAKAQILKGDLQAARLSYNAAVPRLEESDNALRWINRNNIANPYLNAAWVAYQLGLDAAAVSHIRKYSELKGTSSARLWYARYLALTGDTGAAQREFKLVNLQDCSSYSLAQYYLNVGDFANAELYFKKSYAEQKTSDQRYNWRNEFKQDTIYPRDIWAKARSLEWFKNIVQM